MNQILTPVPPDEMLQTAHEDIAAIKSASGMTEQQFRDYCGPVLKAFAAHVQQMPLSDIEFRDQLGAWKFGLLTSRVAFSYAKTQIFFPTLGNEERNLLEAQCHFAAFVAAIATAVAIMNQNAEISSLTDELVYHAVSSPQNLHTWLKPKKDAKFVWRTVKNPLSPAENAAIASRFIPAGLFEHFDLRVSLMVFGAISPQAAANGIETTLAKVVRLSMENVINAYMQNEFKRYKETESSIAPDARDGQSIVDRMIDTNGQVAPASQALTKATPAQETNVEATAESLMKGATKELKEWFHMLTTSERFGEFKNQLVETEFGIEVPAIELGKFGAPGPVVKAMLEKSGMLLGRSSNGKAFVLPIGLKSILLGEA